MKPSRENVFGVMARLEQAGALPESGVTSVFLSDRDGSNRRHPTQLAVRMSGDTVFVHISRLPVRLFPSGAQGRRAVSSFGR